MKTEHRIFFRDSREMKEVESESIDLMITSPPYPMIQMWDEMFSRQNKEIEKALNEEKGELAFELMHKELDKTWKEVYRTLKEGGIACINIGDATRSMNKKFQIYPNHARILNFCLSLGFHALPEILWIKETNKPDKFMGSGMLPVGAYVTLEHEHILILRKGSKRDFSKSEEKLKRQNSAFFWEERNVWFSDRWKDINGVFQNLSNNKLRQRSGAYPFELSYRLINMFSIQGDTVLDPFLGTGTTTLGAIASMRNSIGMEIDNNFEDLINQRIDDILNSANDFNKKRIDKHLEFVKNREKERGNALGYENEIYKFPVMTRQEIKLEIPVLKYIRKVRGMFFEAVYD